MTKKNSKLLDDLDLFANADDYESKLADNFTKGDFMWGDEKKENVIFKPNENGAFQVISHPYDQVMGKVMADGHEMFFAGIDPYEPETISLVILGEPKGQKRHRSTLIGKGAGAFISNYDPSKRDKKNFADVVQGNAPKVPFEGPLKLDVHAFFGRPKSHYRTGKNSHILKDDAPLWKTSKPDRDNVDKFVLDSLTKIYWKDDAMICAGEILKQYSDKPRLEIFITKLK
jgi:Holliday junction resolvase RusA-like endonuclease